MAERIDRRNMRIAAVVGLSDSGKTGLVTSLIQELKSRGLTVFAVKRCGHGFSLDREGSDSQRFAASGADAVGLVAPESWAVLGGGRRLEPEETARRLFSDGIDVVLIEGGKSEPGLKKILVIKADAPGEVDLPRYELLAAVTDDRSRAPEGVPVFTPDETAALTDLILSQEERTMYQVKLDVDGQEVSLNPFVQAFIERTVLGMVSALNGVPDQPESVRVDIRRERKDEGRK